MSDLPTREWFIEVDSVTSLIGYRRYGLTDIDLVNQLKRISREARQFSSMINRIRWCETHDPLRFAGQTNGCPDLPECLVVDAIIMT